VTVDFELSVRRHERGWRSRAGRGGGGDGFAPAGPPNRVAEPPAYGCEALRLPLRLAESCSPDDRRLAARAWPALRGRDPLLAVLGLDGARRSEGSHPAALARRGRAAHAAGRRRRRP
jgi:hypothetical protein